MIGGDSKSPNATALIMEHWLGGRHGVNNAVGCSLKLRANMASAGDDIP